MDWIKDILTDLERFAYLNDLEELKFKINETRMGLEIDLAIRNVKAPTHVTSLSKDGHTD